MSYELKVKNFQSIKNLTLPIKGFTALVGKSNRGKSAILRSLRTVLLNEWNAGFTTLDEKETEVTFSIPERTGYLNTVLPDMDIAEISVKKPANEYTLISFSGDTVKYPKVGKNVPEKFEDLNLSPVITEREDVFNLNFQSQLDPLFLITSTDTEITSFINKVFDISRFEKALREMKTDDIRISKAVSNLEEELKTDYAESVLLEDKVKDLNLKVDLLSVAIKDTEKLQTDIIDVGVDIARLQGLELKKDLIEKEKIKVKAQNHIRDLLFSLQEQVYALSVAQKELFNLQNKKEEVLSGNNCLVPKRIILQSVEQIQNNLVSVKEIRQHHLVLQKHKNNSDLLSLKKSLNVYFSGLSRIIEAVVGCKKDSYVLPKLQDEVVELSKKTSDYKNKVEGLSSLKSAIFTSLGVCPICEQEICKEK